MDTTAFDPRPDYLRALDQLAELLLRVTPGQLDRPTPCDAYDLRALLGHTVGGVHRIAYVGEGGRSLDVVAAVGEVGDAEWAEALGRARARAVAAWADDAKLDLPAAVPWGTLPGRFALGGYLMEAVTHTWDIAQVVAPDTAFDEDLARGALAVARQTLPAETRDATVPFGPVRPAPADAGPTAQLAAWLGREVH
ncbi:TIGR03086 family metal-binding protein [Kitasatospora sp. NPDC096147]|uniref:TIGR03086 family metal-binding protein n=1 Tax=Kitasatospora sp. NPDC096147 TaxID=3364093 RepID=UPI003811062D